VANETYCALIQQSQGDRSKFNAQKTDGYFNEDSVGRNNYDNGSDFPFFVRIVPSACKFAIISICHEDFNGRNLCNGLRVGCRGNCWKSIDRFAKRQDAITGISRNAFIMRSG
jgi:hypothetical protein